MLVEIVSPLLITVKQNLFVIFKVKDTEFYGALKRLFKENSIKAIVLKIIII